MHGGKYLNTVAVTSITSPVHLCFPPFFCFDGIESAIAKNLLHRRCLIRDFSDCALSLKSFIPAITMIRKFLVTLFLLAAQAYTQCYPSTPNMPAIQMSDCIDILEQVLSEDTATVPFDLTQQQNTVRFPYLRYSGSCALRIQLLHQNPNTTFSLMGATRMATNILRACMTLGEPSAGGQASVGPTSELMIALGGPTALLVSTAQDTEAAGPVGPRPHGIPWGR